MIISSRDDIFKNLDLNEEDYTFKQNLIQELKVIKAFHDDPLKKISRDFLSMYYAMTWLLHL